MRRSRSPILILRPDEPLAIYILMDYVETLAAYMDGCRETTKTAIARFKKLSVEMDSDQQRSDIGATLRQVQQTNATLISRVSIYLQRCQQSRTVIAVSVDDLQFAKDAIDAARLLLVAVMATGKKAIKWTDETKLVDRILLSGEFSSIFSLTSFIYAAFVRGFHEQQGDDKN